MLFGRKITVISPYEQKQLHSNINFVKLERIANAVNLVSYLEMRNFTLIELIKHRIELAKDHVDFVLGDQSLMNVVKSDEKFDLFLFDANLNDALLGVAHYLKLPVVAFKNSGPTLWTNEMVKNPMNPSYNPNTFMGFTDRMDFFERIVNTAMTVVDRIAYQ